MAEWGTVLKPSDAWGTTSMDYGAAAAGDNANWGGDPPTSGTDPCTTCRKIGHASESCPDDLNVDPIPPKNCYGCGEPGHQRDECPNPEVFSCRYCKKEGHMVKECPDRPPMVCENCGEEGHMRRNCENARKVNRDHVASIDPDAAWDNIKRAVSERDIDDCKEAVQEYVKAVDGNITYRQLQEAFYHDQINLWLIATERPLLKTFTNMDFQGNMNKTYSVSYRLSEKPDRPREAEGWPQSRDEILARLDDAGEVVDRGIPMCLNCRELGHISKHCTEERSEHEAPKIACYNCGSEGHRVRDCPDPRVDKFACKNCGKSGHKVADCEEPPNLDNVECRRCNEMGHFAKDCPKGVGNACRNCGEEGHMSRECDKPRSMENVTCRNCENTGHFPRDCPEPKDWSKVQCSNCDDYGHTKVRCQKPPRDAQVLDQNSADAYSGDNGAQLGTGGDSNWEAPADTGGW